MSFNLVLVAPEIPGNTGSLGRTCLALNARLTLIHPLGFSIDEKAVRRAGLDYWKYVSVTEHQSWEEFLEVQKPNPEQMFFFSKNAKKIYTQEKFEKDCTLVFGSESKGLPTEFFQKYPENFLSLPILSPHVRSLNLSNAATAVCYEVHRQLTLI